MKQNISEIQSSINICHKEIWYAAWSEVHQREYYFKLADTSNNNCYKHVTTWIRPDNYVPVVVAENIKSNNKSVYVGSNGDREASVVNSKSDDGAIIHKRRKTALTATTTSISANNSNRTHLISFPEETMNDLKKRVLPFSVFVMVAMGFVFSTTHYHHYNTPTPVIAITQQQHPHTTSTTTTEVGTQKASPEIIIAENAAAYVVGDGNGSDDPSNIIIPSIPALSGDMEPSYFRSTTVTEKISKEKSLTTAETAPISKSQPLQEENDNFAVLPGIQQKWIVEASTSMLKAALLNKDIVKVFVDEEVTDVVVQIIEEVAVNIQVESAKMIVKNSDRQEQQTAKLHKSCYFPFVPIFRSGCGLNSSKSMEDLLESMLL